MSETILHIYSLKALLAFACHPQLDIRNEQESGDLADYKLSNFDGQHHGQQRSGGQQGFYNQHESDGSFKSDSQLMVWWSDMIRSDGQLKPVVNKSQPELLNLNVKPV